MVYELKGNNVETTSRTSFSFVLFCSNSSFVSISGRDYLQALTGLQPDWNICFAPVWNYSSWLARVMPMGHV